MSFLQHHIAEQKRFDASLSGTQAPVESSQIQQVVKEAAPAHSDTLVLLPNDANKKTRKSTRTLYGNKGTFSSRSIHHCTD